MTGFDVQSDVFVYRDERGDEFIGAQSDVDTETMAARHCIRSCLSGRRGHLIFPYEESPLIK